MVKMKIDVDKIREVIGSGGKVIQKICADTGAKIDIEDDGTIYIAGTDKASCDAAKKTIETIVFVPEVGQLYYGKVVRILQFGASSSWPPARTAWCTSPSWPTAGWRRWRTWSTSAT